MSWLVTQRKSFGLDISERTFRLVQLKKSGSKIKLVSYNELAVPKGVLKDGKIVLVDKAVELINQLINKAKGQKISTRFVTTCLAEQKTFIKLISLPYPESKDILEEIVQEAKKHIPYPLDEVYLDWQYISRFDRSQILIGVCPKEIVDNYQEVLMSANLTPVALEIEATAVVRSIFPVKQKNFEPITILDLGASRTGLIVYVNNTIAYSLSLQFSCSNLTEILKNKLKISLNEAEKAKTICGLDRTKAKGFIAKILEPEIKKLAQSIREANYFYQEHFQIQKPIKKLYLTGGGSLIPKLDQFLASEVKIDVVKANPLVNLTPGSLNIPAAEISSYTTAIGLALRDYSIPS